MSLSTLHGWMNDARRRGYAGPRQAAVLMTDGSVIQVPDLADWMGSYQILSGLHHENVAATFCKAPKGGWGGSASVMGLRGNHYIYTRGAGDDLDAAIQEMAQKLLDHNTEQHRLNTTPEAKLEALLSSHDWYSAYSDNPGTSTAGDHDWDNIRSLMSQVPADVARTLFNKYAPQGDMTCPV